MAVRPESIRLQRTDETEGSGIAIVENLVYSGAATRLSLRIGAQELVAMVPADAPELASYERGTRVRLDWADSACAILLQSAASDRGALQ